LLSLVAACHDPIVVRSRCILALLTAVCGCGEGGGAPPKGPPIPAIPPSASPQSEAPADGAADLQAAADAAPDGQVAINAPTASTGPVGHLTGPDRLAHAFQVLANLEDGHRHDDARILQFGDSHTASDLGVAVFRRALQARFGEGGRGFVPFGKPWKGFIEDGVRGGMDKEFESTKVKYHKGGAFTGLDGCYGLLGIGIQTEKGGAMAWTDITARAPHVEMAYGQGPHGGSFDVLIDGARAGRIATRATDPGGGFFAFDVPDAPHHVEVRTVGDGEVRIYGMNLDRREAGVIVDALGINGAQIFTPLRWGEACFAEQVRHVSPDLVVLAYGTNEAVEPGLTDAQMERGLVDMLGRLARAQPTASCMLLGPPDLARHTKGQDDWKTWPRLPEIVAIEKRVAEAAGCAFYDQMEAMGGPGSMAQWASEADARGGRDRVHLTRTGYAQLATSFATDLMRAYDDWRAEHGLAPGAAPAPLPAPHSLRREHARTWGTASR
jgi:lysophospholipase L1-like esterase